MLFFLGVFDALLSSEGCGLVRDMREHFLRGIGLLVSPRSGHFLSTVKHLSVKEKVFNYNKLLNLQFNPAGMKKNRAALSVGFESFMESCQ